MANGELVGGWTTQKSEIQTTKAHNWLWVNFLWFLFLNMCTTIKKHHYHPCNSDINSVYISFSFSYTSCGIYPQFFLLLFRGRFWRENLHIFATPPINLNEEKFILTFSPFFKPHFHVFILKVICYGTPIKWKVKWVPSAAPDIWIRLMSHNNGYLMQHKYTSRTKS